MKERFSNLSLKTHHSKVSFNSFSFQIIFVPALLPFLLSIGLVFASLKSFTHPSLFAEQITQNDKKANDKNPNDVKTEQEAARAEKEKKAQALREANKKVSREKALVKLKASIQYAHAAERRISIRKVPDLEEDERGPFIPLLKELAIKDADPTVRQSCLQSLDDLRLKDAESVFVEALKDEKEDAKRIAVTALVHIEANSSAPKLAELLKDANYKENSLLLPTVIRSLGELEYPKESGFLKTKLDDPSTHQEIRKAIITYFGAAKCSDQYDGLLKLAEKDDEEPSLRAYAVHSLGRLGDKRAVEPIRKILESIRSLSSSNERTRMNRLKLHSIAALIRLGDKSVEDELIASAKDDDANVRLRAVRQLGEMKIEKARELLTFKAEYDENARVRKAAKEALAHLDGKGTKRVEDDESEDANKEK